MRRIVQSRREGEDGVGVVSSRCHVERVRVRRHCVVCIVMLRRVGEER